MIQRHYLFFLLLIQYFIYTAYSAEAPVEKSNSKLLDELKELLLDGTVDTLNLTTAYLIKLVFLYITLILKYIIVFNPEYITKFAELLELLSSSFYSVTEFNVFEDLHTKQKLEELYLKLCEYGDVHLLFFFEQFNSDMNIDFLELMNLNKNRILKTTEKLLLMLLSFLELDILSSFKDFIAMLTEMFTELMSAFIKSAKDHSKVSKKRLGEIFEKNKHNIGSLNMGIELSDILIPDNEKAMQTKTKNQELANKYLQEADVSGLSKEELTQGKNYYDHVLYVGYFSEEEVFEVEIIVKYALKFISFANKIILLFNDVLKSTNGDNIFKVASSIYRKVVERFTESSVIEENKLKICEKVKNMLGLSSLNEKNVYVMSIYEDIDKEKVISSCKSVYKSVLSILILLKELFNKYNDISYLSFLLEESIKLYEDIAKTFAAELVKIKKLTSGTLIRKLRKEKKDIKILDQKLKQDYVLRKMDKNPLVKSKDSKTEKQPIKDTSSSKLKKKTKSAKKFEEILKSSFSLEKMLKEDKKEEKGDDKKKEDEKKSMEEKKEGKKVEKKSTKEKKLEKLLEEGVKSEMKLSVEKARQEVKKENTSLKQRKKDERKKRRDDIKIKEEKERLEEKRRLEEEKKEKKKKQEEAEFLYKLDVGITGLEGLFLALEKELTQELKSLLTSVFSIIADEEKAKEEELLKLETLKDFKETKGGGKDDDDESGSGAVGGVGISELGVSLTTSTGAVGGVCVSESELSLTESTVTEKSHTKKDKKKSKKDGDKVGGKTSKRKADETLSGAPSVSTALFFGDGAVFSTRDSHHCEAGSGESKSVTGRSRSRSRTRSRSRGRSRSRTRSRSRSRKRSSSVKKTAESIEEILYKFGELDLEPAPGTESRFLPMFEDSIPKTVIEDKWSKLELESKYSNVSEESTKEEIIQLLEACGGEIQELHLNIAPLLSGPEFLQAKLFERLLIKEFIRLLLLLQKK